MAHVYNGYYVYYKTRGNPGDHEILDPVGCWDYLHNARVRMRELWLQAEVTQVWIVNKRTKKRVSARWSRP